MCAANAARSRLFWSWNVENENFAGGCYKSASIGVGNACLCQFFIRTMRIGKRENNRLAVGFNKRGVWKMKEFLNIDKKRFDTLTGEEIKALVNAGPENCEFFILERWLERTSSEWSNSSIYRTKPIEKRMPAYPWDVLMDSAAACTLSANGELVTHTVGAVETLSTRHRAIGGSSFVIPGLMFDRGNVDWRASLQLRPVAAHAPIERWELKGGEWYVASDGGVIKCGSTKAYRLFGVEFETKEQAERAANDFRLFHLMYQAWREIEGWDAHFDVYDVRFEMSSKGNEDKFKLMITPWVEEWI